MFLENTRPIQGETIMITDATMPFDPTCDQTSVEIQAGLSEIARLAFHSDKYHGQRFTVDRCVIKSDGNDALCYKNLTRSGEMAPHVYHDKISRSAL